MTVINFYKMFSSQNSYREKNRKRVQKEKNKRKLLLFKIYLN